ncbi:MAG: hypothetical protein A2W91_19315 [Bacteroidetes bacterium GWF2_38_335]|nr:MAG: hypothetical protein A2W91_19315 [Bacteroidetes bacterium GWF2_38_335]OFY79909.1 MAG: hypothetical protein A2281_10715 [Bacteroidetes bacterium RIFOXYA12_FULL_38_20]HBS86365.1 hypothetical protein [Bacteroidales bacterium]
MKLKITFYLIILQVIFLASAFGQTKGFTDADRSAYILDIIKKTTWSNISQISEFKITVIEPDSSLYEAIKAEAAKRGAIFGKPIKIIGIKNLDQLTETQVLFFNKRESNVDIYMAHNKVKGKNTLMLTENYEYHSSMINFIVDPKGIKRYEINEKKIEAEGFVLPTLFIGGAVKSQTDWEALYENTEKLLEAEKQIVDEQNKKIAAQLEEIKKQTERIEIQKKEIEIQQQEIDKQKRELDRLIKDVNFKQKELQAKSAEIAAKTAELIEKTRLLDVQKAEIKKQEEYLVEQKKAIVEQEDRIKEQKSELSDLVDKVNMQNLIIYLFAFIILVVVFLGYFIYRSYKIKKRANKLLAEKNDEIMQQNEEIKQQKEEIETQRDEIQKEKEIVEEQRDMIHEQKEEILSSIVYAQRIQRAILPPEDYIGRKLQSYFILNKPRDIVSGDYYWFTEINDTLIVAAADCTGHGVPGAFMSMLGVAFLNEIVGNNHDLKANEILNKLREHVIRSLRQTGKSGEAKDGMDIALVKFNEKDRKLQFAGANNPIYVIKQKGKEMPVNDNMLEGETHVLFEIKADKMPIGIYGEEMVSFTNNEIQLGDGDSFYLFSDGYADQFGGPKSKKLKYKTFKEILLSSQNGSMSEQEKLLDKTIEDWKAYPNVAEGKEHHEQIDDILVIGVRL